MIFIFGSTHQPMATDLNVSATWISQNLFEFPTDHWMQLGSTGSKAERVDLLAQSRAMSKLNIDNLKKGPEAEQKGLAGFLGIDLRRDLAGNLGLAETIHYFRSILPPSAFSDEKLLNEIWREADWIFLEFQCHFSSLYFSTTIWWKGQAMFPNGLGAMCLKTDSELCVPFIVRRDHLSSSALFGALVTYPKPVWCSSYVAQEQHLDLEGLNYVGGLSAHP